jgi:hypothetical protein
VLHFDKVIQFQEVLEYYTVRLARSKLVIDIKTAVFWDVTIPYFYPEGNFVPMALH